MPFGSEIRERLCAGDAKMATKLQTFVWQLKTLCGDMLCVVRRLATVTPRLVQSLAVLGLSPTCPSARKRAAQTKDREGSGDPTEDDIAARGDKQSARSLRWARSYNWSSGECQAVARTYSRKVKGLTDGPF